MATPRGDQCRSTWSELHVTVRCLSHNAKDRGNDWSAVGYQTLRTNRFTQLRADCGIADLGEVI